MTDPCAPLKADYDALLETLRALQAELHAASPQEKPYIVAEIRQLRPQLNHAEAAYTACLANNPKPDPLTSHLTNVSQRISIDIRMGVGLGHADYETHPAVEFMFSGLRDVVTVTSYAVEPIVQNSVGGLCNDTATTTLVGHPTGAFADRQISLPMRFHVAHTNIFLLAGSDIDVTMRTAGPGGLGVASDGHVILVGEGVLQGALQDSPVTVSLEGWLNPVP